MLPTMPMRTNEGDKKWDRNKQQRKHTKSYKMWARCVGFDSISLQMCSRCMRCVCMCLWSCMPLSLCVCVRCIRLNWIDKQGCHFNVKLIVWLFLLISFRTFVHFTHITIKLLRNRGAHSLHIIYRTNCTIYETTDLHILLSHRNRIKYKTNTHFTTFWLAIYLSEEENTRCSFHQILFI